MSARRSLVPLVLALTSFGSCFSPVREGVPCEAPARVIPFVTDGGQVAIDRHGIDIWQAPVIVARNEMQYDSDRRLLIDGLNTIIPEGGATVVLVEPTRQAGGTWRRWSAVGSTAFKSASWRIDGGREIVLDVMEATANELVPVREVLRTTSPALPLPLIADRSGSAYCYGMARDARRANSELVLTFGFNGDLSDARTISDSGICEKIEIDSRRTTRLLVRRGSQFGPRPQAWEMLSVGFMQSTVSYSEHVVAQDCVAVAGSEGREFACLVDSTHLVFFDENAHATEQWVMETASEIIAARRTVGELEALVTSRSEANAPRGQLSVLHINHVVARREVGLPVAAATSSDGGWTIAFPNDERTGIELWECVQ